MKKKIQKVRNKPYKNKRIVNPLHAAFVGASKLTAAERKVMTDLVDDCFDALRRGELDYDRYIKLSDSFNMAQVMTGPGFGLLPDHLDKFLAAQNAMVAVGGRRAAGKSWTCYASEIEAIATGLEFYKIQLDFVSIRELEQAARKVEHFHAGARSGNIGRGHVHTPLGRDA